MEQVGVFLFLPLIGGYVFVQGWYLTKFHVQREDGHRLYFRAAYWGAILFLAVALARAAILGVDCLASADEKFAGLLSIFAQSASADPFDSGWFVATCFYALMLGHVYHIGNLGLDHVSWLERAISEHGTDLDAFLYDATKAAASIMITLDSGKVYIGFVTRVPKSAREKKDLGLLPLVSGYRNASDKMRLSLTTSYLAVYKTLEPGARDRSDFEVILPVARIVSCSRFDFQCYGLFNPQVDLSALGEPPKGGEQAGTP